MNKQPSEQMVSRFRSLSYVENMSWWFRDPRIATLAWIGFTTLYWTVLVLTPCIIDNSLANAHYVLWIFGMVGVCSVYYAVKAGKPADSAAGKPIMAFTALAISCDWCARSFYFMDDSAKIEDAICMFCHSLSLLWCTLFFYNRAVKSGAKNKLCCNVNVAWLTLILEWLDLILMCIAIIVLDAETEEKGGCLSKAICIGYWLVLMVNLIFWFAPIMFGLSETERSIHIHMIVLDSVSDLPLVLCIILSGSYDIHWFIFCDIAFKLCLLLRSYAYHGFIHLVLRHKELKDKEKEEKRQMEVELQLANADAAGINDQP